MGNDRSIPPGQHLSLDLQPQYSGPLDLGQQPTSGLDEAPVTGRIYGRRNRGWVDVSAQLEELQEQLDQLPEGYDELAIDLTAIKQAIAELNLLYGDTVAAGDAAREAIAARAEALIARAEAILAREEAGQAALDSRQQRLAAEIAAAGVAESAQAVIESTATVAGYVTSAESAALSAQAYAQIAQVAEDNTNTVVQSILESESTVLAYKNAAESAASNTQTNRQAAETAAAQASSEATRSTQAAAQADGASSAAIHAAEQAETRATHAGTYASAAQGHANTAESSASAALNRANAATAAQLAAEVARDSAVGAAQATVTTASTVEALVSDTQALVQAASQSATQAATKASEAGTYASQASQAASSAEGHASASAQDYSTIFAIVGDPNNPAAGTLTAAVSQMSSVVADWSGQLEAEHVLSVNANNVITGLRLRASPTESSMLFAADTFQFWTQQGNINPFTLDGNQIRFNGTVEFSNILNPPSAAGDSTQTVIDGGLITTGTIQLQDDGGTTLAGITAAGNGPTNVRFWAGSSYNNRQSAPYRVTQEGQLWATNAIIEGTISGSTITGPIITGGMFRTSGSGERLEINGEENSLKFYDASGIPIITIKPTDETVPITGEGIFETETRKWGVISGGLNQPTPPMQGGGGLFVGTEVGLFAAVSESAATNSAAIIARSANSRTSSGIKIIQSHWDSPLITARLSNAAGSVLNPPNLGNRQSGIHFANTVGTVVGPPYIFSSFIAQIWDPSILEWTRIVTRRETDPLPIEVTETNTAPTHEANKGSLIVTNNGVLYINTNGSTAWAKVGGQ